ncbi:MAG: chromate resistance protein [Betaproteobacteria bacterium]|nr:chromate resistance protein [Betaproteobacteria bacterium]
MKWVTKDFVHLDRVACPWLIKRFVDPDASFVFVPWGEEHLRPSDAIPFAITGAELGPHDADGTTFDKILRKYRLDDPALAAIADIVRAGVDFVLRQQRPAANDEHGPMAYGLLAISEGMMLLKQPDTAIIESSLVVYDALYANFKAHHLLGLRGLQLPPMEGKGPSLPTMFLRKLLKEAKR